MTKLAVLLVGLLTFLGCTYNEQVASEYVFGAKYQTMMHCLTSLEDRFGKSNLDTQVFTPAEISGTLPGDNVFSCVKGKDELLGVFYQESYTLNGTALQG